MYATAYLSPCSVCGDDTMHEEGETNICCTSCAPHICAPEFFPEEYCGWCGKDLTPYTGDPILLPLEEFGL